MRVFDAFESTGEIRDEWVDGDSLLWVLGSRRPFLRRYTLNEEAGRAAEPDSTLDRVAKAPFGIGRVGGRLWVWDPARQAMLGRATSGRFSLVVAVPLQTADWVITVPEESFAQPFRFRPSGGRFAITAARMPVIAPLGMWFSQTVLVSPNGMSMDTVADVLRDWLHGIRKPLADSSWNAVPYWDACPNDRFVLFDPVRALVVWRTSAGELVDSATVPDARGALTDLSLSALATWALNTRERETGFSTSPEVSAAQRERVVAFQSKRLAKLTPRATNLLCDSHGRAWVQFFETNAMPAGRGATWAVLEPRTPAMYVRMPEGFQPLRLTDNLIAGIHYDTMTVPSPAVIRLDGLMKR